MKRFFISGHLDLTPEEFERFYARFIVTAVVEPDIEFVVGDARGCDALAQGYLRHLARLDAKHGVLPFKVTVFHMHEKPRRCLGPFELRGGFASDEERDAAMTAASDFDIAWVRPGRAMSGTAKNIERRRLATLARAEAQRQTNPQPEAQDGHAEEDKG